MGVSPAVQHHFERTYPVRDGKTVSRDYVTIPQEAMVHIQVS
jgi:hypothetical protein